MHIVVCDDYEWDRQDIYTYLQKYYKDIQQEIPQITLTKNGEDVRNCQNIDILFLDIVLEKENGIELAAEINRSSPDTLIIFVSNYPFYVTNSYQVKAAQFLVKPLVFDIFTQVMQQVMEQYHKKQAFLVRRCEGEPMVLLKEQIVYIKSQKRILTAILTTGKQRQYYGKLREEEILLSEYGFIRCHRQYLVNLRYVYRMDRNAVTVILNGGIHQDIPIGESMYQAVYMTYLKYIALETT